MKKNITLILSIAVVSLILTSCLSSGNIESNEKLITVSASGSVTLTPDMATFNVEASETKKTTSEALNETNKKINEVLTILYKYGIDDKDISTNSINLSPRYNWEDGKQILIGQSASQSINVKLKNIDVLGKIIDEIGSISNINLYSINFDKEDKESAYNEARTKAVQNAIAKATTLVEAANMELGEPISISEGSISPYVSYDRVNSSKMLMTESAMAPTQTPTGELTITTSVNIIFNMK